LGFPEGCGAVVVVVDAAVVDVVVDVAVVPECDVDVVWAASSSDNRDSSAVSVVCAETTSFVNAEVLTAASASPALTCWFSETSTVDTVPATWKSAVASSTGDAVPEMSRSLCTEAVVGVPTR
jgi:hypothetical protein